MFLKVPTGFLNYVWENTSYGHNGKSVSTTEIDKVLTNFIQEYKPILFTYEFIQYVNRQTFLFNRSATDAKINFAVSLYKKICNVPNSTDEELKKTLSFYLGNKSGLDFDFTNSFEFNFSTNLQNLENLLASTEKNYIELLKITPNESDQEVFKIPEQWARELINIVKVQMIKDKNDFFAANMNGCAVQAEENNNLSSASPAEQLVDDPRIRAMLDVIVYAEGTGNDYGKIANGIVKRSPFYPELIGQRNVRITNFSRHPQIYVDYGPDLTTAAGRYQFLYKTWKDIGGDNYDFSPRSQDIIAVKLMKRRRMIEPLLNGNPKTAIYRGSPEWASLPMENGKSYHDQPVKKLADLLVIYNEALKK